MSRSDKCQNVRLKGFEKGSPSGGVGNKQQKNENPSRGGSLESTFDRKRVDEDEEREWLFSKDFPKKGKSKSITKRKTSNQGVRAQSVRRGID